MGTSVSSTTRPKARRPKSLFLRWGGYILQFSLLLSLLAKYIPPEKWIVPAFFGVGFPLFFIGNVLWVGMLLLLGTRRWWCGLLLCIISLVEVPKYMQFGSNLSMAEGNTLKLISYNAKLFGLYNWTDNLVFRNGIFDFIQEETADVICFQEFFHAEDKKYFITLDSLVTFQPANQYHVAYTKHVEKGGLQAHFGIATFSRFPILNRGEIRFTSGSNNICIYTDLLVHDTTLRVYNLHLASIHSVEKDILTLSKDTTQFETKQFLIKALANRMKQAFLNRAQQANTVREHIAASPYPVILCGDFNDTPSSYAYSQFSALLNDAFVTSGEGYNVTFNGSIPGLRIDYILHDPKIKSTSFGSRNVRLSDHFPIVAEFSLDDL